MIEKEKRRRGEEETGGNNEVNLPSSLIPHPSSLPVFVRLYRPEDYPTVLALWEEAKLRPYLEHGIRTADGFGRRRVGCCRAADERRGRAFRRSSWRVQERASCGRYFVVAQWQRGHFVAIGGCGTSARAGHCHKTFGQGGAGHLRGGIERRNPAHPRHKHGRQKYVYQTRLQT